PAWAERRPRPAAGRAGSTLTRETGSFPAPNVCGSDGAPSAITGNPDQNGLATGCYRFTLTGADNVGNVVTLTTVVKVDKSDPAVPALTPSNATGDAYYVGTGTTVWFRPAGSGSFDVTASSSDDDT